METNGVSVFLVIFSCKKAASLTVFQFSFLIESVVAFFDCCAVYSIRDRITNLLTVGRVNRIGLHLFFGSQTVTE